MPPELFRLRDGHESDHPFVFSTLLRDYKTSDFARHMTDDRRLFFGGHHEIVERLLRRAKLDVACGIEDDAVIVGWMLWEPAATMRVHYLYTREAYRQNGVAKALVNSTVGRTDVVYSHRTRLVTSTLRNQIPENWTYNAYAALT